MTTTDHVFLTRYNLPSRGAESLIRAREHWLTQRTEMFERITIPAMTAQTVRDYTWLVFFDSESPAWLKEKIARWEADGVLTPVFGEDFPAPVLLETIREHLPTPSDRLLTSTLDNDDGLATTYVERVQAAAGRASGRAVIYLENGLIQGDGGVYLRHDPDNAFCSVVTPWSEPTTCWADWHNRLHLSMPAVRVPGDPGWLQVIHGDNVSNKVRGRLVSPVPYRALYGTLLDDAAVPTQAQLLRERFVRRPLRSLRDGTRALGKRAIMLVGGKRGLETFRNAVAKVRGRG